MFSDDGEKWSFFNKPNLRFNRISTLFDYISVVDSQIVAFGSGGYIAVANKDNLVSVRRDNRTERVSNNKLVIGAGNIIEYTTNKSSHVGLSLYSLQGRRVVRLVDNTQPAGTYAVTIPSDVLTPGIYILRLESGNDVISRRFIQSR